MYQYAMQGRIDGHRSFYVSVLPVDMPVKDPIVSSPLECEAVRISIESLLNKAGPGGADVIGSQSQGPACVKVAPR